MLDLRKLHYLATLARRANYARAAEELGISQPALTRSIKSLERQLGMRLLDRDRAGVGLTPQGRTFVDEVSVLLMNAEEIERRATLTSAGAEGRVRFGLAPTAAKALLSSVLLDRLSKAPNVKNIVVVRNVEALWPLLTAGEIEFFISAEGQIPEAPPVRMETLGHFPLSYIVRRNHPLIRGETSNEFFPLLIANQMPVTLPTEWKDRIADSRHVIEDFDTLTSLTLNSNAVWISSRYAVMEELKTGTLQELSPTRTVSRDYYRMVMYALERRTLSPAARILKASFRRRIKELEEISPCVPPLEASALP